MTSPDAAPKPFQFRLRSIFLATAAVGVAFGLLRWLGLAILVILAVQTAAIIALFVKSNGTAWRGMVCAGLVVALLLLASNGFKVPLDGIVLIARLTTCIAGGFACDA